MATVYKPTGANGKPTKYWQACYYGPGPDGRRVLVRKTTKRRQRTDALQLAVEWERAGRVAHEGRLSQQKSREILAELMEITGAERLEEFTVEGWFNAWLDLKTANAAEKTMVRYRSVIKVFLKQLGAGKTKPLEHLATADLLAFQKAHRKAGKTAVTVNLDTKIIGGALRSAQKRGIIRENPAAPLETLKGDTSTGREPFNEDEVKALLAVAEGDWKGAILAGVYTGARLGDVVRLTWGNVDLAENLIRFKPQKTSRSSGKELVIPIQPPLAEHLLSLKSSDDAKAFVFPILAGKKGGGAHGLSLAFKRIMEKAGIKAKLVRERTGKGRSVSAKSFHSLRHTLNSWMHNAGVSQEIRQRILGHSSPEMNNRYTHTEQATIKAALSSVPMVSGSNGHEQEATVG